MLNVFSKKPIILTNHSFSSWIHPIKGPYAIKAELNQILRPTEEHGFSAMKGEISMAESAKKEEQLASAASDREGKYLTFKLNLGISPDIS